jgi:uncharacterized SAM-binding protein YcdF (DUF218 family)
MTAPAASAGVASEWLAREDPLERCPALVVLSADHPGRADEAVRLYRDGFGMEVWLADDPRTAPEGDAGIGTTRRRLVALGVPAPAIHRVTGAATSTRAELASIAAEMRRRAIPCAVLVTAPLHLRRVRVTWQHLGPGTPRAVIRATATQEHRARRNEPAELALTLFAMFGRPR